MTASPAAAPPSTSGRLRILSSLLTAASYVFTVATVIINLADVTTDIIVAVEFAQDGHWLWFWLVASGLILAHVVYTAIGAAFLRHQDEWEDILDGKHWALRVLFWLPIAQLLPLIHLIRSWWYHRQRNQLAAVAAQSLLHRHDDNSSDGAPKGVVSHSAPLLNGDEPSSSAAAAEGQSKNKNQRRKRAAVDEERDAAAASRMVGDRLHAALDRHLQEFGFFYVESAVEAAPQAIIQLLAITFLGRASPAQLVSLCCSLFSITSKAVIISQAYDARVMVFKFALAAHDVFSTFYLFSTLVAQETRKDTSFFGLEVSWIGYIWLWKIAIYAALAALYGLALYVVTILDLVINDNCSRTARRDLVFAFAMYVVGFAPGLLGLEACKLTWLNLLSIGLYGGGNQVDSRSAIMSSFLLNDDKERSRLRHALECLVVHETRLVSQLTDEKRMDAIRAEIATIEVHPLTGHVQSMPPKVRVFFQEHHRGRTDKDKYGKCLRRALAMQRASPGKLQALVAPDRRNEELTNTSTYYCAYQYPHIFYRKFWEYLSVDKPAPARIPVGDVTRYCNPNSRANFDIDKIPTRYPIECDTLQQAFRYRSVVTGNFETSYLMWFAFVLAATVLTLGGLISTAYPYVNAAYQFHTHNLLQSTCFYATCVALVLAVVTAPFALWVFPFHRSVRILLEHSTSDADTVLEWIAAYHEPPYLSALGLTVPAAVLPVDITTDVVASFLTAEDVGMGQLSIAESAALKARIQANARTVFAHRAAADTDER